MDAIAVLLKSYQGDFAYAQRLVSSFLAHNADELTMYCVVPRADLDLFSRLASDSVRVLAEEELVGAHLVTGPIGDLRTGYVNQEIVKMAFWETGITENYFCVDSDAVFLRDFSVEDFLREGSTPYTVLIEDNDLKVDPAYYAQHWQGREKAIRTIMGEVGLDDPIMRTCHGHQIFSARVWETFKTEFLEPRDWTYRDALACSPYEFSWYAMWLQKRQPIPVYQREPLVKVFHTEEQHLTSLMQGVTEADLARGYLAAVVNSNFSRDLGLVSATGEKTEILVPYLSYQELGRVLMNKARRSLQR